MRALSLAVAAVVSISMLVGAEVSGRRPSDITLARPPPPPPPAPAGPPPPPPPPPAPPPSPFHLYWNPFRNSLSTSARGEGRRSARVRGSASTRGFGYIQVSSI